MIRINKNLYLSILFLAFACHKEPGKLACDVIIANGWVTSPAWLVNVIDHFAYNPNPKTDDKIYPLLYSFTYNNQDYILVHLPTHDILNGKSHFYTCEGVHIMLDETIKAEVISTEEGFTIEGGGLWGELHNHAYLSHLNGFTVNASNCKLLWMQETKCDEVVITDDWITSPEWLIDAINRWSIFDTWSFPPDVIAIYPMLYTFTYNKQDYIVFYEGLHSNLFTQVQFYTCQGEHITLDETFKREMIQIQGGGITIKGAGLWGEIYNYARNKGVGIDLSNCTLLWLKLATRYPGNL